MSWEMIRNLVRDEWVILSLLLVWSLAGLTVICERLYALWNLVPKSEQFKNRVIGALEAGDLGKAAALCEMSQVPLAEVFERGLQVFQKTPHKTAEAVTSQRGAAVLSCKRYLWALGTVGSSAPRLRSTTSRDQRARIAGADQRSASAPVSLAAPMS